MALARAFLVLAALWAMPGTAQMVSPAVPVAEEASRLRAVGARGRLLFDLDRAAWVATNDLLARMHDPAEAGLKGYVIEREGAGFVVTFYGGPAERPLAMYVAHVAAGKVVSSRPTAPGEQVPLSPLQSRLAAARTIAGGSGLRPCGGAQFNVAAIPPASPDAPLELYLTSAQVRPGTYPAGGHYLLVLTPDGRIASTRQFTNSCLDMSVPANLPRGATPAALVVAHFRDPTPTEIHAFLSIRIGKPVYVIIGDPVQVWRVDGEMIAIAAPGDPMAKTIRRQARPR